MSSNNFEFFILISILVPFNTNIFIIPTLYFAIKIVACNSQILLQDWIIYSVGQLIEEEEIFNTLC